MPPNGFAKLALLVATLLSTLGIRCGGEEPSELVQARAVYRREIEFASRPIRDRYLSKLDALKRSLGSRGDARAALAVQEEIDAVNASLQEPADLAKVSGNWVVTYKTGTTNRFIIRADGSAVWDEENGKPISVRSGRVAHQGGALILQFDGEPERLWRLSLSANGLAVDFFEPRNTYPGTPRDRGSAIKSR